MIGRLEKTVLDCPDPRTLARFYAEILGMQVLEDDPGWVVIGRQPHMREPALGAVRRPGAPETGYRVFEDPAGHPFCLVHGREVPDPRFA